MGADAACGPGTVRQGDIYYAALDPAVGREQKGARPVLVISADKFNAWSKLPVVASITNGGDFARRAGFAVPLAGWRLKTTGIVRCDQIRVADLSRRRGKFIERAPDALVQEVIARVQAIFGDALEVPAS